MLTGDPPQAQAVQGAVLAAMRAVRHSRVRRDQPCWSYEVYVVFLTMIPTGASLLRMVTAHGTSVTK